MKKRDIIQLVKETVKENTFYGNREMPSQLSTGTKVSVPTDEYPFSAKPKRTATGMMEFQQPKSFDPDTLALVRDMLEDADIHHNELVGGYDEPSSYLDKRTGGTIIKIPHFNGPPNPALFGKETVNKIDRSKAAAKTVAAKLYYKFKTYIEDYEISDKSPAGVYGNIYLWMMFNDLAKDYSAPKGGTQSSQFENKELSDNPKLQPGKTVTYSGTRYKVIKNSGYVLTLKSLESGKTLKLNLGQLKDKPIKENNMKNKLKEGKSDFEVGYKDGDTAILSIDDKTAQTLKTKASVTSMKNLDTMQKLKGENLDEEPDEGNAFGLAMQNAEKGEKVKVGDQEFTKKEHHNDDDFPGKNLSAWDLLDKLKSGDKELYDKVEVFMKAMKETKKEDDPREDPDYDMDQHYMDYDLPEEALETYMKERKDSNLNEHMDKHRKRVRLMEGATEKLFKLFNAGKTDSEVRAHYLQMQVDMPESFISKLRKNWEDLRKTKLDLTLADKEAEGFEKIQPEPSVDGMEGGEIDGMEEDKQLASGLFTK